MSEEALADAIHHKAFHAGQQDILQAVAKLPNPIVVFPGGYRGVCGWCGAECEQKFGYEVGVRHPNNDCLWPRALAFMTEGASK